HVFWLQSLVKAMFRQNTIDKTYIAEENSNSLIFLNAVFSLFQQALHIGLCNGNPPMVAPIQGLLRPGRLNLP
ncbi:hypothetical protein, partial [Microcoleus sp. OTE_8_concoct_300]|uniref:hypothetical protein n=1 Tax=Microcoleus sp. OTE_8_concoct_300 TaxID=2964710 RepID=UPI00403F0780